jgi:ABC-2 type transport system permease protein
MNTPIHGYKLRALFTKDLKDTLKNPQCLIMAALPLVMVLLYSNLDFGGEGMDRIFVLIMGALMALCILPVSLPAQMISEEKEKFTLRTLMLSNVTAWEFLLSKVLVTLLLMLVTALLILGIVGLDVVSAGLYLLSMGAGSLCMVLLGALVGILAKNQMSTGLFSAPVMLVMLLPAILGMADARIERVARFLPTHAVLTLLLGEGGPTQIAVLAAWTALSAALFVLAYQRKRLD